MHFLREQRPVSRLQILLIQMKTCIASSCLWAVAILKSLLCLNAGALQESRGCSWYEHTAFRVFFTDWQLAPAGLHSDLVSVDADWHRLNLLNDSRLTSQETQTQIWNWHRQLPPSTPVVHYLQTVHCMLPLSQWWQNSCIFSRSLIVTAEKMLPTLFQVTAQSEQHWHSNADIEGFICHKLKSINKCTSHWICLRMGAKGMLCSSKLQVK